MIKTCSRRVSDTFNYHLVPELTVGPQTPLYKFHHKSVQLSKFVWITEAHSFIYEVLIKYSNRTYTWSENTLIEQRVVPLFGCTIQITKGSDNRGPIVLYFVRGLTRT